MLYQILTTSNENACIMCSKIYYSVYVCESHLIVTLSSISVHYYALAADK